MANKFFMGAYNTQDELKREYKKLAFVLHPDKGGNQNEFVEMTEEYRHLSLNFIPFGAHYSYSANPAGFYSQQPSTDPEVDAFTQKISSLISISQNFKINATLNGSWIWVSGDTYTARKELLAAGFSFVKSKAEWCWHFRPYKKKGHRILSHTEIARKYGEEEIV